MPANLRTLLLLPTLTFALSAIEPAPQPTTGPGGSDYPHAEVTAHGPFWPAGLENDNRYRYFIYQPASPSPATAPVVLFLHGYLANSPANYLVWMSHMTRKGFTVVWVQYDSFGEKPRNFADNAIASWRDALAKLQNEPGLVRPARADDGSILAGVTGHSAGGWLSAVIAARSAEPSSELPWMRAVVAIEPGGLGVIQDADFSAIPAPTRLLLVVGEDDRLVCKESAQHIWNRTSQLGNGNRDFLIVRTDTRGTPELTANHVFPATFGLGDLSRLDNRDYYVTFKLSVAAMSCSMYGQDCAFAFGQGSLQQTSMGLWSDGVPVKPMLWTPAPAFERLACER